MKSLPYQISSSTYTEPLGVDYLVGDSFLKAGGAAGTPNYVRVQSLMRQAIEDLILGAGLVVVVHSFEWDLDSFPTVNQRFVVYPLIKDTLIVQYYPLGSTTLTTLPTENYAIYRKGDKYVEIQFRGVLPQLANRPDAIVINFDAGYTDTTQISETAKQFIELHVGYYFDNVGDFKKDYQSVKDILLEKLSIWGC